jgi:hypothetical protein
VTEKFRRNLIVYLPAIVFALSVGLYGVGASNSPLSSDRLAERQEYVRLHTNLRRAELRAQAYWARNPDVAENAFFGEGGGQGIFGAWVHYERHGIHEGREWGL